MAVSTYIPESVGSKDILFENAPLVGTVDFFDGVLIFSPAFLFLMIGDIVLPEFLEAYIVLFSIFLAICGLLLLVMKPNYMTLYEWVKVWRTYRFRDKDYEKNYTDDAGNPFNSISAVPDNDTRKLTMVDRVYPERDVVELDDGTMLSIIEFSGSNLDMAAQEQIIGTVNQYSQKLSSQLQHDIQFYMPLRPVSTEETAARYRKQQENLQVKTRDDRFLQMYLEDRVGWVDGLSMNSYIREQYVVVAIKPAEVTSMAMQTNKSGLASIPGGELLVDIFRGLTGNVAIDSEQELKRKQLRELSKRRDTIRSILTVGPGNESRHVNYKKSLGLIKEFWEGEKIISDEMDALSNEQPFSIPSQEQTVDKKGGEDSEVDKKGDSQ